MNIYSWACEISNACNGRAIVNNFQDRILPEIVKEVNGCTDEINSHPVMIVYLDKMMSLAGIYCTNDRISEAYNVCLSKATSPATV